MSVATQATAREVREWFLNQDSVPEGLSVGARGRLSTAVKDYFTAQTGREVVETNVTAEQ